MNSTIKSLDEKLARLRLGDSNTFILADAKDADMAWGVASTGSRDPHSNDSGFISIQEFRNQCREITARSLVDIMLASVSTMDQLSGRERLFDDSMVTPAIRANDTTDLWCLRRARYADAPSRPFASTDLEEAQRIGVSLGLYSMTFVNQLEPDLRSLEAFKAFRLDASRRGFRYFLEVFAPNVDAGIAPEHIPAFVNDCICRTLAAVPAASRPEFLKIPYFGPRALEELVQYDSDVIVGILGGSSGTTLDAFQLIHDARKYGARVALFGRKIKNAEHPVAFIEHLWSVVNGEQSPQEAVRSYHNVLAANKLRPKLPLQEDCRITSATLNTAAYQAS